jgi:hypothetical protein
MWYSGRKASRGHQIQQYGFVSISHTQQRKKYCNHKIVSKLGFPPWPDLPLFIQPGRPRLPQGAHIDVELSADVPST